MIIANGRIITRRRLRRIVVEAMEHAERVLAAQREAAEREAAAQQERYARGRAFATAARHMRGQS
jgi:hypothetical protein